MRNNQDNDSYVEDAHPFVFDISEENISVGYGSGNTTFAVMSNTNWTVNKDAEWIMFHRQTVQEIEQ